MYSFRSFFLFCFLFVMGCDTICNMRDTYNEIWNEKKKSFIPFFSWCSVVAVFLFQFSFSFLSRHIFLPFIFLVPSLSLFWHISFRRSHMFWIVYLFLFFCCWKTLNLDYACIIASSKPILNYQKENVCCAMSVNWRFFEYSNFALFTCVAKIKSSASNRKAWILWEETNYKS